VLETLDSCISDLVFTLLTRGVKWEYLCASGAATQPCAHEHEQRWDIDEQIEDQHGSTHVNLAAVALDASRGTQSEPFGLNPRATVSNALRLDVRDGRGKRTRCRITMRYMLSAADNQDPNTADRKCTTVGWEDGRSTPSNAVAPRSHRTLEGCAALYTQLQQDETE
jgi:hypothetical protein